MRVVQKVLNNQLRKQLRQDLVSDLGSSNTSGDIDAATADRLWHRIATQLPQASLARDSSSVSWWQLNGALLSSLTVAVAGILLMSPLGQLISSIGQPEIGQSSGYETLEIGVKGPGFKIPARLSSLRFATVNPDGTLTAGHEGMELTTADVIVFSVEATGIDRKNGEPVILSYSVEADKTTQVIAEYILRNDQETLQGTQGYVAFKPSHAGTYDFQLRSKNAAEEKNVVGFKIRVVDSSK